MEQLIRAWGRAWEIDEDAIDDLIIHLGELVDDGINQCDGCRQGLPVINGIHFKVGKAWIACTRSRYEVDSLKGE